MVYQYRAQSVAGFVELTLDQKRVGVLEVDVHNSHHSNTHKNTLNSLLKLGLVVLLDSGGDELRLLSGHRWCRLHVLEGSLVYRTDVSTRSRS
jgi:hypothetical protein